MKTIILLLLNALLFSLVCEDINAQNTFPSTGAAGIGTTTPNTSSLLEMNSTTKGLLIPRMTVTQRNAIATPAAGLMIYQTNSTSGFYYYDGTGWKAIAPKTNWALTGNAGTNPATNFIGTTDGHPLVFRVNNLRAAYIDFGTSNTSFGYQALISNSTGNFNTATGTDALLTNTLGNNNTANGSYALLNNTIGIYNTATGSDALHNNTSGNYNTATGAATLYTNTTGYYNTANGYQSLYTNTSGFANTSSGYQSLYFNTSGYQNTAIGLDALRSNTSGYNNTATGMGALLLNNLGNSNTANGYSALAANTAGSNNTAVGNFALLSNTTGYSNVALGVSALSSNTVASNLVAIGDSALYNNGHSAVNSYDATYNTAVGSKALYTNTTGSQNIAVGAYALNYNTTGGGITAGGVEALLNNTTGSLNTSIGYLSGNHNATGNDNTYLGAFAGPTGDYDNSTAIGTGVSISASNQVRIGDNSVTSIGGYVNWSNISDGRVKKNIKENVPGLTFINKLKPITYNLNLDAADKIIQRPQIKDKNGKAIQTSQFELDSRKAKEQIVYTGFVAQDVEKAAKNLNYDFSGVDAAKNNKDLYGLRYADFVVPLVKAVQELSSRNDDLQKQIDDLKALVLSNNSSTTQNATNTVLSNASLEQNIPNPFTHTTTITYNLPQKFTIAQIIITDNTGKTLKSINVSGSGKGSLNVDAATLASGAYNYSLIIDGKLIGTKQMVLAK